MFVLQSCSNSLHILPGLCSETHATSGGVCNFSSIDVKEDVDEIEVVFMSINEEVDRGLKQEEIPGDLTFPDLESEPVEMSYVCICLVLDTFYQCLRILFFLVMLLFLAN